MRKPKLLEGLVLSASVHLAVAVGATFLSYESVIHPNPTTVLEVEVVEQKKGVQRESFRQEGIAESIQKTSAPKILLKQNKSRTRRNPGARKRQKRAKPVTESSQAKTNTEPVQEVSPLLRMRQGPSELDPSPKGKEPAPKSKYSPDQLARIFGVKTRTVNYEDGGRLVRNLTDENVPVLNRPENDLVAQLPIVESRSDLNDLAERLLPGGGSGESACNPYKRIPLTTKQKRVVHIYVDTSGSTINTYIQTCASGIAIAALRRGYFVAITNFSNKTIYVRPGREPVVISGAIKRFQGEGTPMPKLRKIRTKLPVDTIFVTDGAIDNPDPDVECDLSCEKKTADTLNSLAKSYVNYANKGSNKGYFFFFPGSCFSKYINDLDAYNTLRRGGFKIKRFPSYKCVLTNKAPPS